MGTATHVTHDSLRDPSVDTQNGASGEARRVTGEVERRTHDLVRDPASPEGEASLRLCLEAGDGKVLGVGTPSGALEALERGRYDLVFLDLWLGPTRRTT